MGEHLTLQYYREQSEGKPGVGRRLCVVTGKLLVIIQILLSHKVFGAQIDSVCTCASACLHVQVRCNWERGMGLCLVRSGLGETACKGAGLETQGSVSK